MGEYIGRNFAQSGHPAYQQAMHIVVTINNSIARYAFPENLKPWRDSNPGLLFMRRTRCPLLHAARAMHIEGCVHYVKTVLSTYLNKNFTECVVSSFY
jgi:hypothetical protein